MSSPDRATIDAASGAGATTQFGDNNRAKGSSFARQEGNSNYQDAVNSRNGSRGQKLKKRVSRENSGVVTNIIFRGMNERRNLSNEQ